MENVSNDESSSDTSSSCDVELLQLALEGEGSFNPIIQRYRVGLMEEDKDDEDDIRIMTLESQFENKETVLDW